jgi:hypothetical protein
MICIGDIRSLFRREILWCWDKPKFTIVGSFLLKKGLHLAWVHPATIPSYISFLLPLSYTLYPYMVPGPIPSTRGVLMIL